jgi:hypothetical protein
MMAEMTLENATLIQGVMGWLTNDRVSTATRPTHAGKIKPYEVINAQSIIESLPLPALGLNATPPEEGEGLVQ